MFIWPSDVNWETFFWLPKRWIIEMDWANLSLSAKSILPVIAAHVDRKSGIAFPSEDRIGHLAGRTPKSVRQGVKDLDGFADFKVWRERQRIEGLGTRWGSKRYRLHLPKQAGPNEAFPFRSCFLLGGNWSLLTSAARALYPVLATVSKWDADIYKELDLEWSDNHEPMDTAEEYGTRRFNLIEEAELNLALFSELAGISRRGIKDAMKSLEERGFIERESTELFCGWKVYIRASYTYKRKWLNGLLAKQRQNVAEDST